MFTDCWRSSTLWQCVIAIHRERQLFSVCFTPRVLSSQAVELISGLPLENVKTNKTASFRLTINDRRVKVQHLSHRGPCGNSVSNGIFHVALSYPPESLSNSNLHCFLFYSITKKSLFSEKYSCFVLIIRWLLSCGQKRAWKQRASELQKLGAW